MASGDLLVIECTDPLTTIDIPNLLNQTGDKLEASRRRRKVLTFRIRKTVDVAHRAVHARRFCISPAFSIAGRQNRVSVLDQLRELRRRHRFDDHALLPHALAASPARS